MDALRQSCHPVGEFQLVFPLRRSHGAGLLSAALVPTLLGTDWQLLALKQCLLRPR
ncbi:hypothetical protein I79_010060 [Cricetulus griseus]|uniref:Uncharacterized protein n=1 Tax=Cricetulus griseus TaxID=10029 RepID=G3HHF8_CRIGR|nr:hypothetical protein I79_010060 [Cricetulus griseus]